MGQGVIGYVLGTGIDIGLSDLAGRVDAGPNFVKDGGSAGTDCFGFTTKFADIIAGTVYGVAKRTNLISLRTTDCKNVIKVEDYLTAISWVIDNGVRPAFIFQTISDYCVNPDGNKIVDCAPDTVAAKVKAEESAYTKGFLIIDAAGDGPGNGVGRTPATRHPGRARTPCTWGQRESIRQRTRISWLVSPTSARA